MLQMFIKRVVFCLALTAGILLADDTESARQLTGKELFVLKEKTIPGTKPNLSIEKGDYKLTFDGRLKIETFYEDNAYMLNKNIPDENNYFKETMDLNLDFEYGEKKYGYDAIEAYLSIRHKGVWGYALKYADRDAGSSTPISLKMSETLFGQHSHAIGRSLLWLKEAWLRVGLNAIFGNGGDKIHYLQAGWFPFELGRGIALGSIYGQNQEFLGLYNYAGDDKSAPGINLNGEIVKDTLWYDLYYARFEEHEKSFSDVIEPVRGYYIGRRTTPWRGIGKEDDLIAARLLWKPVDNAKYGKLQLEPYAMCDFASDQWVEINPDAKTTLGAAGLGLEHVWKDFEWGGEVAFNFGQEKLMSIDRNIPNIERGSDSNLREYYSHILNDGTGKKAGISDVDTTVQPNITAQKAAEVNYDPVNNTNGSTIPGSTIFKNTGDATTISANDRFRQGYTNDLRGWMGVIDAAYSWRPCKLKFAVSYGYASGDTDPHREQKSKKYNGFIGIHESYMGKRVPSIFMLDMRLLKCPLALPNPDKLPTNETLNVEIDMSFTDIQTFGLGVTWSPKIGHSTFDINPNATMFWNACDSHKIIYDTVDRSKVLISPDLARKYFGTELNLITKSEIIKDLTLFGRFAMFIPGGYFKDVAGIPLDGDFFNKLAEPVRGEYNPKDFRLGSDNAYHVNIGLDYKF
ncbi:MAG: hypothetical protein US49_C0003G0001 [candidate division TM6 bacterium GW2011_GWF2_37_49]|nr:MAG: hypothetical protein US49_C0003G0001 [candidate division TM6 bacterium GW2011_GWF2_37_49]